MGHVTKFGNYYLEIMKSEKRKNEEINEEDEKLNKSKKINLQKEIITESQNKTVECPEQVSVDVGTAVGTVVDDEDKMSVDEKSDVIVDQDKIPIPKLKLVKIEPGILPNESSLDNSDNDSSEESEERKKQTEPEPGITW